MKRLVQMGLVLLLAQPSYAVTPDCLVELPRLTLMDRAGRLLIERHLQQNDLRFIAQLHQRHTYVTDALKRRHLPPDENRAELEKEKAALDKLAAAWVRFAVLAREREDWRGTSLFQTIPEGQISTEIDLLRDNTLLKDLDTETRKLQKVYREYTTYLREQAKVLPYPGSNRAIKGFAILQPGSREKALAKMEEILDNPRLGAIYPPFPAHIRFTEFSAEEGKFRICYILQSDGSVVFEKIAHRSNFYDDLASLRAN